MLSIRKNLWVYLIIVIFISSCTLMKNNNYSEPKILSNSEWVTKDKKTFKYTSWVKSEKPKAIIISVHGLSGASSDFEPLGEYFQNKNINVYAINERGQGNDPEKNNRGDINSYKQWIEDLQDFTALVSEKNMNAPIIYYAESLGALITGNLLIEKNPKNITGVIFASPVIKLDGEISWWQNLIFRAMIIIRPTQKISFSDLSKGNTDKEKERVTRDDKYQDSLAKMPHAIDGFTLRFLKNVGEMIENINKNASKITQKTLIIYAGKDIFTKPDYIEKFYDKLGTKSKERIMFPESYHLLLHDYDKDKVLENVESWIDKTIQNKH